MFGEECVDFTDDKNVSVAVDGKTIHISLDTRVTTWISGLCEIFFVLFLKEFLLFPTDQTVCYEDDEGTEDDPLREMVEMAVQRLYDALNPVIWPRRQDWGAFNEVVDSDTAHL